jgi:hypothetical protein
MSTATPTHYSPEDALLRHHGDVDATSGLIDLAVNVRPGTRPNGLHASSQLSTSPTTPMRPPPARPLLDPPFTLDPARVPDDAGLVAIGNPTNPTAVPHPADKLPAIIRPMRGDRAISLLKSSRSPTWTWSLSRKRPSCLSALGCRTRGSRCGAWVSRSVAVTPSLDRVRTGSALPSATDPLRRPSSSL